MSIENYQSTAVFKEWPLDQLHRHHLGVYSNPRLSSPRPDLLSQNWGTGMGAGTNVPTNSLCDS